MSLHELYLPHPHEMASILAPAKTYLRKQCTVSGDGSLKCSNSNLGDDGSTVHALHGLSRFVPLSERKDSGENSTDDQTISAWHKALPSPTGNLPACLDRRFRGVLTGWWPPPSDISLQTIRLRPVLVISRLPIFDLFDRMACPGVITLKMLRSPG